MGKECVLGGGGNISQSYTVAVEKLILAVNHDIMHLRG